MPPFDESRIGRFRIDRQSAEAEHFTEAAASLLMDVVNRCGATFQPALTGSLGRDVGEPEGTLPSGQGFHVRAVLVSDRALVRSAMRSQVTSNNVEVVGQARGATDAIRFVEATRADVAVLDLSVWPLAALSLVQSLDARDVGIVGVTSCDDVGVAMTMLKAGVRAYLLDRDSDPPLLEAVLNVKRSDSPILDKSLRAALGFSLATHMVRPRDPSPGELSPNDIELLTLLTEGCSNKEISRRLGLTVRGVEARLDHMLLKLNARNRTEAAARAGWLGLYHTPDLTERIAAS